ncbi:MAG: ABC transporter ATP-binding protein [Rhodovulum sp.]|jgi:NitT/TauT family transport system ATP-binding protein|nr:sulfonate ABC transporter ATP-binding protein [Rhodovulum sp.]MCI5085833.1 ABC transporter ATP-binding protein [Rhodovulum sp.]|tara:strand:+ start:688 stop:1524 length:837 start_codon:yes stop_codon:yes gene_type:complete
MLDVLKFKSPTKDTGKGKGRIDVNDVVIRFGKGADTHLAVDKTEVTIEAGEFVCILGPSGCGKSTLLNAIAGYVKPSEGAVTVDGDTVQKPGPDRGMVFQQYSLLPWKTVYENVAFGPKMAGHSRTESGSIANTFLELVGLKKFGDRYPAELSGGMQQRVGIARALANYPSVLLMDEPFGALDAQTRLMMQESLLEIWRKFGTTVVFVTHDVDEAVFLADRVLIMSAAPGRIIEDVRIDLPRPRSTDMASTPEYVKARQFCLDIIKAESRKAFENQNT